MTTSSCRPTRDQQLLLKAALLPPDAAESAWRQWRSRVDPRRVDGASTRLLPLVAHNLAPAHVDAVFFREINAAHRQTWAANRLRLARLGEVLQTLADIDIATLVLKGAALATLYYPDAALRPMDDVDVLVPTSRARDAIALLRRAGWAPVSRPPELLLAVTHAHGFQDGDGIQLDLHWHALWECCDENADDDFWANAIPLSVGGVLTRTLDPTDHLLLVCVHGARWSATPPIRWAADATMILRTHGVAIDWTRLIAQARARRVVLPLRHALAFLEEVLAAPIPPAVLSALERTPVSALERIDYALKLRPRGAFTSCLVLLCHYLRTCHGVGVGGTVLGFPGYLRRVRGLERLRELPRSLGRELLDRGGTRRRPP